MSRYPIKIEFSKLGCAQTKSLFRQYNSEGEHDLEEWRKIFVDTMDPTQYAGAMALLGSWKDWGSFKRQWRGFDREILPEWLEEMEVKIRSTGIRSLILQAEDPEKPNASAARFLAEAGYEKPKMGRPSKDAIKRQAKIEARVLSSWDEDFDRVKKAND